jgi:hypothetical protein
LTSVTIFDRLPPSALFRLGWPAMTMTCFLITAMDGNLEQITCLVDSGKLESGL